MSYRDGSKESSPAFRCPVCRAPMNDIKRIWRAGLGIVKRRRECSNPKCRLRLTTREMISPGQILPEQGEQPQSQATRNTAA